jgi:NAD(P)-dependent dehydrogenase (short-subunit alcohol dehydrogenase family)
MIDFTDQVVIVTGAGRGLGNRLGISAMPGNAEVAFHEPTKK